MTFDPERPLQDIPPGQIVDPPSELVEWLADLALLRGVPVTYLVPDAALLPPESIRFFHVDMNWVSRLLDGALSAASVGTLDEALAVSVRRGVKSLVAAAIYRRAGYEVPKLAKNADLAIPAMTGFLLRSGLVRRWPTLEVRAFSKRGQSDKTLSVVRRDRLSDALLIALVVGMPRRVEIWEPAEGVRFGVEISSLDNTDSERTLGVRKFDAYETPATIETPPRVKVDLRGGSRRVLNLSGLRSAVSVLYPTGAPPVASAAIALALQQTRYVQVFEGADRVESARTKRASSRIRAKLKKARTGGTP